MEHAARQRAIDGLLARYSEHHLNPTNEIIHCICVPAIVASLLGLLWAAHPLAAVAFTLASLVYYFTLSIPFAIGMAIMSGSFLAGLYAMPQQAVLPVSVAVFVVAWIGQIIGHKIEGKKPSLLEDLRLAMIGPLFVLVFLYRRLGIAY